MDVPKFAHKGDAVIATLTEVGFNILSQEKVEYESTHVPYSLPNVTYDIIAEIKS